MPTKYAASYAVAASAFLGRSIPVESTVMKEWVRFLVIPSTCASERRVRKGLAPRLRYELLPFKFQSYQELYNQALTMEQGRKELEASKRPAPADHQSSSSSEGKKRKVFVPFSAVPKAPFAPKPTGYLPPPPRQIGRAHV